MIGRGDHGQAGLFLHLSGAGLLDGFARFQESGQGRHSPGGPGRLAAQQADGLRPALIDRQHDGHRIDAREMLGPAGRTDPLPAARRRLGQRAAVGAKAVLASPVEQALGPAGHGRIRRRQDRRRRTHLLKGAQPGQRPVGRIDGAFELDGEDGFVVPQAQKRLAIPHQGARMAHLQPSQPRPLARLLDQRPPFPQRQGLGVGFGGLLGQPVGIIPQVPGPIERVSGEGVLMGHAGL